MPLPWPATTTTILTAALLRAFLVLFPDRRYEILLFLVV
jgi:hypothetical protein